MSARLSATIEVAAVEVGELQPLVGAMAVRFQERARPGAVGDRRDAGLGIEPRVGVERHAFDLRRLAENLRAVAAERLDQHLRAGKLAKRRGEQHALDLDADAAETRARSAR